MKKLSVLIIISLALVCSLFLWNDRVDAQAQGQVAFAKTTIDVGIVVRDAEKAAQFYAEVLGFQEVPGFDISAQMAYDCGLVSERQAFHVRVFKLGRDATATSLKILQIGGTPSKPVDNTHINSSLGFSYLTILTADTTAAVAQAKQAGISPIRDPYQLGQSNNYLTIFKDPDGNIIELVGPKK
jgi:catechol 2,3-dioxygenase-like lactoylglutathione lyase family enzyme